MMELAQGCRSVNTRSLSARNQLLVDNGVGREDEVVLGLRCFFVVDVGGESSGRDLFFMTDIPVRFDYGSTIGVRYRYGIGLWKYVTTILLFLSRRKIEMYLKYSLCRIWGKWGHE